MLYEVPATVNVYRAECSLSDADSHFFPNNSPCPLLNVSITNTEHIAKDVRITIENKAVYFFQNSSYLNMKYYL